MELAMPDFRSSSIWGPQLVPAASISSHGVKLAPWKHVSYNYISPWGLEGGPASPTDCVLEMRHFMSSSGWTKLAPGHAHAGRKLPNPDLCQTSSQKSAAMMVEGFPFKLPEVLITQVNAFIFTKSTAKMFFHLYDSPFFSGLLNL